jgi:hypothetical protein
MSAEVTVAFDNGRMARWTNTTNADGEDAMRLLSLALGVPDEEQKAHSLISDWERWEGRNAYIAFSDLHTYIILPVEEDVKLYQMLANADLCPLNAERAERFKRFSKVMGDVIPIVAAANAAEEWAETAAKA